MPTVEEWDGVGLTCIEEHNVLKETHKPLQITPGVSCIPNLAAQEELLLFFTQTLNTIQYFQVSC